MIREVQKRDIGVRYGAGRMGGEIRDIVVSKVTSRVAICRE